MFVCCSVCYLHPGLLDFLLNISRSSKDRKGISNWLLQRASACLLAAFFLFNIGYIGFNPELDYPQWLALYSSSEMQIFCLLAVLAMVSHAWIGLWCVYTDYVTERLLGPKAALLRTSLQTMTVFILASYVAWSFAIFWGL